MSESAQLLEEYYAIVQQIKTLQERKEEMRKAIAEQVSRSGTEQSIVIGDTCLRAAVRTSTVVDYDEEGLRLRLGQRYTSVLEPDIKKIRKNLAELQPVLEPHLDTIGSVSRDLVQQNILAGELSSADFAGLFSKKEKKVLYVKMFPVTPPPENNSPY